MTPGSWVWYQARWFWDEDPPSQSPGSNGLTTAAKPAVIVAKQAAFGFNRVPLGECAWTAKDLA